MKGFRLWAPRPERVQLVAGGTTQDMMRKERGWWEIERKLHHGEDYGFLLDGIGPLPDPRSPWQPGGVHGTSRHVDHHRFSWTDQSWQPSPLRNAVIYEMHIGTFTREGDFDAAVRQLDHLVRLGITHLELMPVAEFPGTRGWGYDGVDLYAPHHVYGGPDGLKGFVDHCHNRGLAVLLDVVYNHLGPSGNYLSRFGPYFTDRYRTPWGDAVNLDGPGSDPVRRFFIDNALMWLRDYHLDGLRLDAVHAIMDRSPLHFLEQLTREVREQEEALGRPLVLIAENDLNDPRLTLPFARGGYGLDAQWNEDFHHALHAVLTGERDGYYLDFGKLTDLAEVLRKGWLYDGRYSRYRDRTQGRPAPGLPGNSFVGCLQNHDQVGNRACGERSFHLMSRELLKAGAAIVLTAPFIPFIFQGEEWGAEPPFLYFTDHAEPELAEAVRQGRREEFAAFGWKPEDIPDPQSEDSFLRSKLDWNELKDPGHLEILAWYKDLIGLRRSTRELVASPLEEVHVDCDEGTRRFLLARGLWKLVCNLSDKGHCLTDLTEGNYRLTRTSRRGVKLGADGLWLPGPSTAILFARKNKHSP